jgi:hypothetical protein
MRYWRIAWALCLVLIVVGPPVASAGMCVVGGQRYKLMGETIDWSMKVGGGQTCTRDFRFNTALSNSPGNIAVEEIKLVAAPQFGQIRIQSASFSYEAQPNFSGRDMFVVAVFGKLHGIPGSSTIRVSVSVSGSSSVLADPGSQARLPVPAPASGALGLPEQENASGPLKIGGGGYNTGIQICPDGTMASRVNSAFAYIGTVSGGVWTNVVTTKTVPGGVYGVGTQGVSEIQLACSNTQIVYMKLNGYMLKSTDQGANWTHLAGWTHNSNENPNAPFSGAFGPLIAVDPQNPNVMLTGSPGPSAGQQMYYTTDGGITFNAISARSIAQSTVFGAPYYGLFIVAFDPSSSVSAGQKQGIWVCSYGNQCYHTIAGPAGSWIQTSGGPTTAIFLRVDQRGTVWANDSTGNLWRYDGSWTEVLASGAGGGGPYGVSVTDISNVNNVWAIDYNGDVNFSANGGSSWSGISAAHSVSASDVPWLASNITDQSDMSAAGGAVFDPTGSGKVYVGAGTGVFKATLPTANVPSAAIAWTSVTAQQESLVATTVLSPAAGQVNVFSWDRAAFRTTAPGIYPSNQAGYPFDIGIVGGWSADYAAGSPSTLVMIAASNNGGAGTGLFMDLSGVSTDGGSTWTPFGATSSTSNMVGTGSKTWIVPAGLSISNGDRIQIYGASNLAIFMNGIATYSGTRLTLSVDNFRGSGTYTDWIIHSVPKEVISGKFGGCIAAADTTHFLWLPLQNAANPWYTTDGGVTWAAISIAGIPVSGSTGWGPNELGGTGGCQVTADRVLTDTFYLYNTSSTQPGVYTCTTGSGLNCSRTFAATISTGASPRIKSVPGKAGHLFWSGSDGSSNNNFQHSTDGGAHWAVVTDGVNKFSNVQAFCFGAVFPEQSYPSIYLQGNDGSNLGFYMSKDGGTKWSLIAKWPNDNYGIVADCAGDPVTPGQVYMGFNGSGYAYYGK